MRAVIEHDFRDDNYQNNKTSIAIALVYIMTIKNMFRISPYNLYYTSRSNTDETDYYYDCLYYHSWNDAENFQEQSPYAFEITPYCIRPSKLQSTVRKLGTSLEWQSISLIELHKNNVSSNELLSWSASIDVAEQYQAAEDFDFQAFYNCTPPVFGDRCQYSFEFLKTSFSDIVSYIFSLKVDTEYQTYENKSYPCYAHVQCDRGPALMCLDWREICDGRIDCLNTEEDEKNCVWLELNECADNEFRCKNGICIPDSFLQDDAFSPDCLDGTDENIVLWNSKECYRDPKFRCTVLSPPYELGFSCGDDATVLKHALPSAEEECGNHRNVIFTRMIWSYASHNRSISWTCWLSLVCLHNLNYIDGLDCEEYGSLEYYLSMAENECPPQFFFPDYPIFGYIYLLYSSTINTWDDMPIPNYVCYNHELCSFPQPTDYLMNLSCLQFQALGLDKNVVLNWPSMLLSLHRVFRSCSTVRAIENKQICETNNGFRCPNSSKCITQHRLNDGFNDCYKEADENIQNSCDLRRQHRFKCSSQNKCIQPWLLLNTFSECNNSDDEVNYSRQIQHTTVAFSTICDGFVDIVVTTNHGYIVTDETNCHLWQCDNHYTHCNGVWNCANGIDEIACGQSRCPPNQHACISAQTYQAICLSLNQTGDGNIDCLGSYDERSYCREISSKVPKNRYRCQNSTECVSARLMCGFADLCPKDWRKQICKVFNSSEESLTKLNDEKRAKTYFSLSIEKQLDNTRVLVSDNEIIMETRNRNLNQIWYCNRGIRIYNYEHHDYDCLCPPSHYGDRCQYQSQRVSLTMRFDKENVPHMWHSILQFVIILIDENHHVHSYERITYVATRDCTRKYNINLLYGSRPKDETKTYRIHIDMFSLQTLTYYSSWYLNIPFQFLPINRLASIIHIPASNNTAIINCPIKCYHGRCFKYENIDKYFCQCDPGWYGFHCQNESVNRCSIGSLYYGTFRNHSMCICPFKKFGLQCRLNSIACQRDTCQNGGLCIPHDDRISLDSFTCICQLGFYGTVCNDTATEIEISFHDIEIPSIIFAHFITIHKDAEPTQISTVKHIPPNKKSGKFYSLNKFNLLFIQIRSLFYLVALLNNNTSVKTIAQIITPAHRCPSIHELLAPSISSLHFLERVKFYHALCRDHSRLGCFHDDIYLCLCTSERYSNCLNFAQNSTRQCQKGVHYCQNEAQCFYDQSKCPSTRLCLCDKCYFGTQCQLSTKGLGLSLDAILGYQILPKTSIIEQSITVKLIAIITILMFICSSINGFLSIITFRSQQIRETGCGIYLFVSSMSSIFASMLFTIKCFFLILSHMSAIKHRTFLSFQCMITDFLLSISLAINNWLNACVAVDRAMVSVKGVHFNMERSRQTAKWIIFLVTLLVIMTFLHDPLHRRLIDDPEENRIWCVTIYSVPLDIFNSTINFLHCIIPLTINVMFSFIIILTIARHRTIARTNATFTEHIYQQLQTHKHLLISPLILIILAIPRLMIGLLSSCMTSARDPWLFLTGYYISFLPNMITFFIFVLPFPTYKKQFHESIVFWSQSITSDITDNRHKLKSRKNLDCCY